MINIPNINSTSINTGTKSLPKEELPNNNIETNSTNKPQYTTNIYPKETIPVYTKSTTKTPKFSEPQLTHTSWFYVNDVHGKMTNMERIYNMTKEFDKTNSSQVAPGFWSNTTGNISKFKVSSGDIILGANYTHNQVADKFLNWSGFIASALGNHELDVVEPGNLAKLLSNAKYKMLAVNIEIDKNSPLSGRIEKSTIVEKDGEKYGLIGIAPPDMKERVKMNNTMKDIQVSDAETTRKLVQKEVDKLKEQGINKIVVLSHEGTKNDIQLAKETTGIDIIFA